MRAYLEGRGASQQFFDDADAEGPRWPTTCACARTSSARSPRAHMFDSVYSEAHALIAEEQRWLDDYEASMEGGAQ